MMLLKGSPLDSQPLALLVFNEVPAVKKSQIPIPATLFETELATSADTAKLVRFVLGFDLRLVDFEYRPDLRFLRVAMRLWRHYRRYKATEY
jgi:hypothetical protein